MTSVDIQMDFVRFDTIFIKNYKNTIKKQKFKSEIFKTRITDCEDLAVVIMWENSFSCSIVCHLSW